VMRSGISGYRHRGSALESIKSEGRPRLERQAAITLW